jgi:hypothetical protein
MVDDELVTLRRRLEPLERQIKNRNPDNFPGAHASVLQTTTVGTYPTAAASAFGVKRVKVTAALSEGAPVTLAAEGFVFYALNLGSAVPPSGTFVLATQASGKWVFRYDA